MDFRALYVGVDNRIRLKNGKLVIPINFDSSATTPPMKCAVSEIEKDLAWYGTIGRSKGQKSMYCTERYEAARADILDFFQATNTGRHTVIYVKSATEGLNLLAYSLMSKRKEIVLTTRMEHHANLLPWRTYASRLVYVDVDKMGRISPLDIERKLREYHGRIRYVAITAASNVTGYVNDINLIARICHKYGAKIIVDAAQMVAHRPIKMCGRGREEEIDFLVFSAHKAYAPFGGGAIVGLTELLNQLDPFLKGGSAVDQVFDQGQLWKLAPERMEAGTQNYFGIVSMAAALKKIKAIGFDAIIEHENELKEYVIDQLKHIEEVTLYGDCDYIDDRIGIIVFNVENMTHELVSDYLALKGGVSSRNGKFCAHPYVTRLLGIENNLENEDEQDTCGMVRISFGLFNTMQEAKQFIQCIEQLTLK